MGSRVKLVMSCDDDDDDDKYLRHRRDVAAAPTAAAEQLPRQWRQPLPAGHYYIQRGVVPNGGRVGHSSQRCAVYGRRSAEIFLDPRTDLI